MPNHSFFRRLLSLMLVLTMLGALLVPAASAAESRQEPEPQAELQQPEPRTEPQEAKEPEIEKIEGESHALTDIVRVTILLEDPAAIDAGFSMERVAQNAQVVSYRQTLKDRQAEVRSRIENTLGARLDVQMNLTLLINAISANVRYGDIERIKAIPGVKDVSEELRFELPDTDPEPAQPNTAHTSTDMVGAADAWAEGYTGVGSRIAIIDTGLDVDHQSFDADAFLHAISLTGRTGELFTQTDLNNIKSQLNASRGAYISAKVPFGYNYVDSNTTVTHLNDTQGEHGSHVAGIAAANRFIKQGDNYVDAASAVGAVGMAPDAQLFIMKVFGAGLGPFESQYVGAIEDAITLGCDVVNLSLGSSSPGFSYSSSYQDTWAALANINSNVKLVVSISSGNSASFADYLDNSQGLYIDDVHMHTGGNPGSYVNSLCVASADNTYMTGLTMLFNGSQKVFYAETSNNGGTLADIADSYSYVYIDALGEAEDYSAVNAAESLAGKIVIVNRGEISFADKGNNAKSYNPAGLLVANNESGTIYMSLDDFTGTFPMASITLGDANTIKANSAVHTTGSYTYYTGTVTVGTVMESAQVTTNPEMSDFSSWGVPGSLLMKPEITAPGGNIYSVFGYNRTGLLAYAGGHDQYELMSGTSMAAPHITGLTAVLGQYLRDNQITIPGKTTRQIVQSLLMSTAVPMHIGAADGPYYPILQQGSGLANVGQAVHASSFIFMNEDATQSYADGKVKAEIGDKPSRSGSYSWSFTLYNSADREQTYALRTDLFTQDRSVDAAGNAHMSASTTALDWPVTYTVDGKAAASVTVPAGLTRTVRVIISIPADMSAFDALYPSGAYVEGYTYVESQTTTGDGAKLDVTHSIPILGFYGSWTDPNMFDNMSYVDKLYGEDRTPYAGTTDTNYMTYSTGLLSGTKYVTGNPYFTERPFPADRLALHPSDTVRQITYSLIRSAGTLGFAVSRIDDDGLVTEVLDASVIDTNVMGRYYTPSSSSWSGGSANSRSVSRTFANYGAESGDRVRIGLYAIPEYNALRVNEDLTSATAGILTNDSFKTVLLQNVLGKGAMVGYDFYMDDTAPTILAAVRSGDQIIVTAKDDNWIARLALLNGNTVVEELIPAQSYRGEAVTYSFDISEVASASNLQVFVGDYAANETTMAPGELLYTVTAASNNLDYGTVSVVGSTILAEPAEGYYVESVQVTSGSAAPVISGSTIAVNPSSNCSILVIFAPKPQVTVTFLANGSAEGSSTGYLGDSILLPDEIAYAGFVEGYRFIGWLDAALAETDQEPDAFYAPGERFPLSEDITLYALFKRVEGNEGEVFHLLTALPADMSGRYVISSGTDLDSFILPVIPAGELYKDHPGESRIAGVGVSVEDGNLLRSVPMTNIFTVAPSADNGFYTIESVSLDGIYLADLSAGLSTSTSETDNSRWRFSLGEDGMFELSSSQYRNYGMFYDAGNWCFEMTSYQDEEGVFLWRGEPAGVAYYTTMPVDESHTHELLHHDPVAPTCGEAGCVEHWACTLCNGCFSDAAGENRLDRADTILPATGNHSLGITCTSRQDGTHVGACAVCGQTVLQDCNYQDVVTAPTETAQGYTTHTCVNCGYSLVDTYVAPLGTDFTVTFSVFGDTTVVPAMACNSTNGIELPTVLDPEGFRFEGWVMERCINVTTRPGTVLTGHYAAPESLTLYALFSQSDGLNSDIVYERVTQGLDDWRGRYVVSLGKQADQMFLLTGIDTGNYEVAEVGGSTAFNSTGAALNGNVLSNVPDLLTFEIELRSGGYSLRNAVKNTYVEVSGDKLYAAQAYDAETCDWSVSADQFGNVTLTNVNAAKYPYLGLAASSDKFLAFGYTSDRTALTLWKAPSTGTIYYTTGLEDLDEDYDGIPNGKDAEPGNNVFHGTYESGDFEIDLEYTMDYRDFFGDNTAYNQHIASFSTWAAQFCYENEDGDTTYTPDTTLLDADDSVISTVTHIDQLMRAHGMENVIDYKFLQGYADDDILLPTYTDDDVSEVFLGHHKVSYQGQTIEVIGVFVRGTNGTIREWCSNFDVGNLNRFEEEYDCVEGKEPRQSNGDWTRKSNHRGFDVCATRIGKALELYMATFVDDEATPVFWLTGHSRGAAISNIIASNLVDAGRKVFAYTYAAPNTTANTEASAAKYDCIFNLVNGDDFVPRLPMPEWGFNRYGRTAVFYASEVSRTDRRNILGDTSYSYASDDDLQGLVEKFVVMTVNNAGGNDGWRDVYVYHCCGDGSTDAIHQHPGETVGEYRTGCTESMALESTWNGYDNHAKKFSYFVQDTSGLITRSYCCQTPAFAMQILAITMGDLGVSSITSFLASYSLADRYNFGKTNIINIALKIIDPHYMENYYLIQRAMAWPGNPETAFSNARNLYTNELNRPIHTHTYEYVPYEGMEPTCTETGLGYKVCYCSQINPEWYDDEIKDAVIPALGHLPGEPVEENRVEPTATAAGGYDSVVYCTREGCGAEISRDHVVLPALAPLEDAQLACYLGVTADIELPIGISVLRNVLDGYDDWYVELTWTDDTGTEQSDVVAKDDPSISSGTYFYVVRSAKIPAKQCGDTFQVQAHAFRNGQEYVGPVKESSIKDLLVEQLKSTGVEDAPTYDPICARLCADILNYCASLQLDLDYKEDELCNEFPEDAKARTLLSTWATGAEPQVGNSTNTAEPNNRIFVNVSAQNRVVLGITVYGFSGNVEIHVTDGEGHDMGTVEAFQQGYGKVAYYRELPARGLRASYTYTVFEDGVDTGLYVEWSLERHVYGLISARDSGDPYVDLEQLQVFINLLKFIDSATAMFPGL